MNAIEQAAQRFPLIARPRPACVPLPARVAELRDLASASAQRTGADHLALAAETLNKAALVASDCGARDLARSLCWRHFNVYLPAWPLDAQHARRALEPLVNLARLAIRAGDAFAGYQLLEALFHAVGSSGETYIDGRPLTFDTFTRTSDDLRTVRQWLYGVFVAEGIRALISTGRWHDAVVHAQQYRGVGERLLDGRQAAIVAYCLAGDTATATALVADSISVEPWEHAVASCLRMLCDRAAERSSSEGSADVHRRYLEVDQAPGLAVFRARLGLTIVDLASDTDQHLADRAFAYLISDVLTTRDGYAAREVLAHQGSRTRLAGHQHRALTATVESAGLELGAIPDQLLTDLHAAVKRSEGVLARSLDRAATTSASAPSRT